MSQITTRLPDALVAELDEAASRLKCSRVEIIRQAIESYLEEFDDLSVVIKRLRDPSDPALNWGIRSDVSFSTRIKRSVANKLERIANLNRARIVESIDWQTTPSWVMHLTGELRSLRRLRVVSVMFL